MRSWPAVSGCALLAGRAGQQLVRRRAAPTRTSGSSVTTPRRRPCGVSWSGVGAGDARELLLAVASRRGRFLGLHGRELLLLLVLVGDRLVLGAPPVRRSSRGVAPRRGSRGRSAARARGRRAARACLVGDRRGRRRARRAAGRAAQRAPGVVSRMPLPVAAARSARERRAGEQDQPGEQQEHDEDLHPDVLDEPVGGLEQRLPDGAAVALQVGGAPRRPRPWRARS